MAKNAGLSKKHSPLQKAHYQSYRIGNRAQINLIRRLRTRVRRAEARVVRCIKRNLKIEKLRKKGNKPKNIPIPSYQHPDKGAIKALKKLKVNVA